MTGSSSSHPGYVPLKTASLRLKLSGQRTSELNCIRTLLQPNDLATVQCPHMSESRGERLTSLLRLARVGPQGNDAVSGFEELGAHGDEALEVPKETAEEVVEYIIEADVDTAMRKAFDD